jgi:hypothetical protein
MQTANTTQQHAINLLMLKTISTMLKINVGMGEELHSLRVLADDVAHNIKALQEFNAELDANILQTAILQQDTVVREEFISVLQYLETNDLVDYAVCN